MRIVCPQHRSEVFLATDTAFFGAQVLGEVVACCGRIADLFVMNAWTQAMAKRPRVATAPTNPTVLFLDDSPVFLLVGEILCRRRGIESVKTASAAECIAVLRSRSVVAVVVSLMLSKGSGFEVIDWLRDTAPHLLSCTIALTETTGPFSGSLNLPVREVFGKPLDFRRLVALVEQCVHESIAGTESHRIEMTMQEA